MEKFQPTLPARGATAFGAVTISYCHFNPRSPHGERRFRGFSIDAVWRFQPTLPARGATSLCFLCGR